MKTRYIAAMQLLVGIDVGSTTVKLVVIDAVSHSVLHSAYERHNAEQSAAVLRLLHAALPVCGDASCSIVLCGSGSPSIARMLQAHYIQEVVAASIAVKSCYRDTRCVIELGGQDAKVIFFQIDPDTGELITADMRMNGSCAGGTGAFIDQVAELLHVRPDEFGALADKGTNLYDISGRCGVFAKTDIQPLLNEGVACEDIALSTFHAIAKQTIGGLSQGMDMLPKVLFLGGPLTFNPRLIEVFRERLDLSPEEIIIPESPELVVAFGAALSARTMFADQPQSCTLPEASARLAAGMAMPRTENTRSIPPYFADEQARVDFQSRHRVDEWTPAEYPPGSTVTAYLGIDAGSTTTKFVLLDEQGGVIDRGYTGNQGDPIRVCIKELQRVRRRFQDMQVDLNIAGLGTTGYGERLFAAALQADFHTVETVAHARASQQYLPDASFILDIGGQDMKAIHLHEGIVTNIVLNEACSAGCGSFIETYAKSLGVPLEHIAHRAFAAEHPSVLGSRCTVFMNSSIITEQKNGKSTDDILAGICFSIIENVFTKVVRVSNMKELGSRIVVQGGTFRNDAVLRAFENYTGITPVRPPFAGEMGAIGIALLTMEHMTAHDAPPPSRFIGLEALKDFSYRQEPGLICPYCPNSCSRTAVFFSNGGQYVTGNRCDRGEIIESHVQPHIRERVRRNHKHTKNVPNLYTLREKLVLRNYRPNPVSEPKDIRIGLPRVLEFWHSMPFWRTFFTALGYKVVVSGRSTRSMFEQGLSSVASDTVCFPAKLSHGHVRDLIDTGVDRIFMPIMNRMQPENKPTESHHVCAVVKGYPMVVRYSDEPERRFGVAMDTPTFYWLDESTKRRQLVNYFQNAYGVSKRSILAAISAADAAMQVFQDELIEAGKETLQNLRANGGMGVVLAGRPYHNDSLINHSVADFFIRQGIPVLPVDALPGLHEQEILKSRPETTINFHVRMLSAASLVAETPELEFVQLVSFGCGHDAVLSDEIIRILRERSKKDPLILKMDESENSGPLHIRITSFIETVRKRRSSRLPGSPVVPLPDPYSVKFTSEHRRTHTVLVPNVTESFAHIASAAMRREGYKVAPLPLADERARYLGKKYVHNDMCFPAQINIGEFLAAMENGGWDPDKVALGLAKDHCDCRLAHYATVARRALDEAGYPQVPIITTGKDTKDQHPDFNLSPLFQIRMLWGLAALDVLENLRRRIRPYETDPGSTDRIYWECVDALSSAMDISLKTYIREFTRCIDRFSRIEFDSRTRRPRIFIIGEFLLNFHPGSNNRIERYLEEHGMEVIMPNVIYNFHREYLRFESERRDFGVQYPWMEALIQNMSEKVFRSVIARVQNMAGECPIYEAPRDFRELAASAEHIIHRTFTSGEGWMIAAEILEHARHGVDSFLILQPFGCLPNHVTGRGLVKRIKQDRPGIQILSLDYDPDTSFANIENRLQMLILTAKERAAKKTSAAAKATDASSMRV